MRVLLLGGTGNLGLRLIPALLAHGHIVTAYVRSVPKLQSLVSPAMFDNISTHEGDAFDSSAIEDALRKYNCDAIMNTAGNRVVKGPQVLGKIATSVSSAAIKVGKERKKPLRAWLIGGMTSLEYPGTDSKQLKDYLFAWMSEHHNGTEEVLRAIPRSDLEWSLLCVAFMTPVSESIDLMQEPKHHDLAVAAGKPPEWQDSWVRYIPLIGLFLNVVMNIKPYTTKLEDVADLLAEDFEKGGESPYVGELVGMKEKNKAKSS